MATVTKSVFDPILLEVMAREIILETQPNFIWKNFVTIKEDISNSPGTEITFIKVDDISGGGILNEEDFVPTQTINSSVVKIKVYEFGNSIEFTRLASQQSPFDLYEGVKQLLAKNYLEVVDNYLRDIFYNLLNTYFFNGTYNGALTMAGVNAAFNVDTIRNTISKMKEALIPPFYINGRQYYVCVLHPRQMASLRQDPRWANAFYFNNTEIIYNGQSGIYEGVIFIESVTVKQDTNGTDPTFGAVFLGENQVGLGIASGLEIIEDPPQDLNRFRRIGWYQIMGAGVINNHGFITWTL
jgi:N4-gp56 family major capsid protein